MLSWPCAGRCRTCVVYLALPCAEASDPSPNAATTTATSSRGGAEGIVLRDSEFCIVILLANWNILRAASALKLHFHGQCNRKRRWQMRHRLVRPTASQTRRRVVGSFELFLQRIMISGLRLREA